MNTEKTKIYFIKAETPCQVKKYAEFYTNHYRADVYYALTEDNEVYLELHFDEGKIATEKMIKYMPKKWHHVPLIDAFWTGFKIIDIIEDFEEDNLVIMTANYPVIIPMSAKWNK